jgi:hypothetical protein
MIEGLFFYLKFYRASTAGVISPMLFNIIGFIVSGIFHTVSYVLDDVLGFRVQDGCHIVC